MDKNLVIKITSMLQAIPEYAEWDIEIIGIQPTLEGLGIVFRNKENPIQRVVELIEYYKL